MNKGGATRGFRKDREKTGEDTRGKVTEKEMFIKEKWHFRTVVINGREEVLIAGKKEREKRTKIVERIKRKEKYRMERRESKVQGREKGEGKKDEEWMKSSGVL